MRDGFWLALIAAALAAIVAGYLQAAATTRPPPIAMLRSGPSASNRLPPALRALVRMPDVPVQDAFAQDDVVVERARSRAAQWRSAQLTIVVALCGNSVAAESGFLRLGVPLAFVVDPNGAQAAAFAQLVRNAGETLFVQVGAPPNAGAIAALRRRIGPFDGIAARSGSRMAPALRGSGLMFFDERGDADALQFASDGVALVRRDVTADDVSGAGYAAFMLERAAALSRNVGPIVVLVRPLPSTLEALRTFGATRGAQMIAVSAGA